MRERKERISATCIFLKKEVRKCNVYLVAVHKTVVSVFVVIQPGSEAAALLTKTELARRMKVYYIDCASLSLSLSLYLY